uniref:Uncharacterized protein n=1 Tax=Peronospora matthiolae TaxID=2874970 RepID=A0AAV1T731_9STRA
MLRDSVRHLETPVPLMFEIVAQPLRYAIRKLSGTHGSPRLCGSVFPPPQPPLEDSRGGQRYLVERLLNHSGVSDVGRVISSGGAAYPQSCYSWEPRSQLMVDVLGLVGHYDAAHPGAAEGPPEKDLLNTVVKGFQVVNPLRTSH